MSEPTRPPDAKGPRQQRRRAIGAHLHLLYEAGNLLGLTLDPDVVYDTLHDLVARVMDCDTLIVSSYTPDDGLIRCAYAWIEGKRVGADQLPPIPLAPEGRGLQSRVIREAAARRVSDVAAETPALRAVHYVRADGRIEDRPAPDTERGGETRSMLLVPIVLEGRVLGVAQVMSQRVEAYSDDDLRLLEALMTQVAAAARNAFLYQTAQEEIAERRRAEDALRTALTENVRLQALNDQAARQRRDFLRDMLAGVSEGRLRLCDDAHELPDPLPLGATPFVLSAPGLSNFRAHVEQVARAAGLPDVRWHDLIAAAGEASMNTVVHAGGGEARVFSDLARGMVQVWISDFGKGIAQETLHRATLERGYTTAGSLGHGFWMMLRTADRIFLLTGPAGTTIVLEQERTEPEPFWLRARTGADLGSPNTFDIDDLL